MKAVWTHETAAISKYIFLVLFLKTFAMILFLRSGMQAQRINTMDVSLAEIQWSFHILPDVEKMFSCCIFLLFIVEAEILPAICVYVYNNFLFLRTLHLLASLARRNTGCSVSCFCAVV